MRAVLRFVVGAILIQDAGHRFRYLPLRECKARDATALLLELPDSLGVDDHWFIVTHINANSYPNGVRYCFFAGDLHAARRAVFDFDIDFTRLEFPA